MSFGDKGLTSRKLSTTPHGIITVVCCRAYNRNGRSYTVVAHGHSKETDAIHILETQVRNGGCSIVIDQAPYCDFMSNDYLLVTSIFFLDITYNIKEPTDSCNN